MTEQQFEDLLRDSIQMYGHTYVPEPPEDMEEHVFSKRYERKMKRLVRSLSWRSCIPTYSPRLLFSKRGLALQFTIMILLSMTPLSAAGDGTYFEHFDIQDTQQNSEILAKEDPDAPETFEQYYQVTWIPEGFEPTYRPLVIPEYGSLRYEYSNGETEIEFRQCTKSDFKRGIDSENIWYERIKIDGHEAVFHYMDGENWYYYCHIYMDYNGYILTVSGKCIDITKNDLIKMLESVQEVSWETMISV